MSNHYIVGFKCLNTILFLNYTSKLKKVKRYNMEDIGRWRGEVSWGKLEGETNHERLWTLRNKLRVLEGVRGWLSLVVGIKEGTYCMEHWVWCINNEFWNTEKKLNFKKEL